MFFPPACRLQQHFVSTNTETQSDRPVVHMISHDFTSESVKTVKAMDPSTDQFPSSRSFYVPGASVAL